MRSARLLAFCVLPTLLLALFPGAGEGAVAPPGRGDLPPGAVFRLGSPMFRFGNAAVAQSADRSLYVVRDSRPRPVEEAPALSVWGSASGQRLQALELPHDQEGAAFAVSPDGKSVALADGRGKVYLIDRATGKPGPHVLALPVPDDRKARDGRTSVAFFPDGKRLVVGRGTGERPHVFDLATGKSAFALRVGDDLVRVSADGKLLATGGSDPVVLFSAKDGEPVRILRDRDRSRATDLAFSPDGRWLATAGDDDRVRVWEVASGKPWHTLRQRSSVPKEARDLGPEAAILIRATAVAFSPDSSILASAGADGSVRLWDPVRGRQLRALPARGGMTSRLFFTPRGDALHVVSDFSPLVRRWDVKTGKELSAGDYLHQTVALSPDGKVLASGGPDGVVHLTDAATGRALRKLEHPRGALQALAFRPDGKVLAAAAKDQVQVWEVSTGRDLGLLGSRHPVGGLRPRPFIRGVTFTDGGKAVAWAGNEIGAVRVWDVAGKKEVRALEHRDAQRVASAGGLLLAVGGQQVTAWDVGTGKMRWHAPSGDFTGEVLAVTPGGERAALLFAGAPLPPGAKSPEPKFSIEVVEPKDRKPEDNTFVLSVHEGATGRLVRAVIVKGRGLHTAATLTRDGRYLLVGPCTTTAKGAVNYLEVHEVATGKRLLRHPVPAESAIDQIACTGLDRVVTVADGMVLVWDLRALVAGGPR